jgi:hypothetical protein
MAAGMADAETVQMFDSGRWRSEMRRKALAVGVSLGLAAVAVPVGRSAADHVRFPLPSGDTPTMVTIAPAPSAVVPATVPAGTVTVLPAPTTVAPSAVVIPGWAQQVVTVPAGQTLRAEQIRAQVVRAGTIYANRIETDQVKGVVHHTSTIAVGAPAGEVVGPDVSASVIYADAIAANSIVADHVYVRDLEMSPARFVIAPLASGIVVRRQSP